MKHKNSFELFDYWTQKRGGRAAPSRTDIEPADIRTLLPNVFICDLAADNQLNFRHGAHHANRASSVSGTLSMPWVPPGPQRPTRNSASQPPFHNPCRAIASKPYSEQVGRCRQELPMKPDNVSW